MEVRPELLDVAFRCLVGNQHQDADAQKPEPDDRQAHYRAGTEGHVDARRLEVRHVRVLVVADDEGVVVAEVDPGDGSG